MRALLLSLPLIALAQPAMAGQDRWHFLRSYDHHGTICEASVRHGAVRAGFYSTGGGPVLAYVHGINLPPASYSTWQVKGYQWQRLHGGKDAASGSLVFGDVTASLLAEVAAGSRLDIYVHATQLVGNAPLLGTFDLSLSGSSRALARFLDCHQLAWAQSQHAQRVAHK